MKEIKLFQAQLVVCDHKIRDYSPSNLISEDVIVIHVNPQSQKR